MKRLVLALAMIVAALGLVACGGGGNSTSGGTSASGVKPASEGTTDESGNGPLREIEERCEFFAEEVRANAPANGAWKGTLEGCREELKDAEEPDRVAREEKENELRLRESRAAYREEREARYEAALGRAKRKVATTKRAEIEALKELCSASVSEAVAEEERTGRYLREYWRECR